MGTIFCFSLLTRASASVLRARHMARPEDEALTNCLVRLLVLLPPPLVHSAAPGPRSDEGDSPSTCL